VRSASCSSPTLSFAFLASVVFCFLLSSASSACSNAEENSASTEKRIAPIPLAEAERAKIACDAYVARVCQCAETQPNLDTTCQLAKGIPQALQMNLDVAAARGLTILQQKAMKSSARKIAAKCFSNDAKLSLAECPR